MGLLISTVWSAETVNADCVWRQEAPDQSSFAISDPVLWLAGLVGGRQGYELWGQGIWRGRGEGAQHSHINFDLVLLAKVWLEKQVLDSSMLHLKASALQGRERIITLALNLFFPFFFVYILAQAIEFICLVFIHSFTHSLIFYLVSEKILYRAHNCHLTCL